MELPKKNARIKTLEEYALKRYNGNKKRASSWLRGWLLVKESK